MIGHTIFGTGPLHVLVLHGWLGDSTVFNPMLPAVDSSSATFAFMDYRGYGKSLSQIGEYSIDEIASDAISLADHLGWDRFHLLGHSMGGKAALRVAANHPSRVMRIVAATPVSASPVPFDADGLTLFTVATERLENRQTIIDITTGSRLPQAWARAVALKSWETSSQHAFASYFDAWAHSGFAAEARGLETEILVLVGEHDAAVTEQVVGATCLKDYPNARLKIIRNAGHYPMQETPLNFAAEIVEFLLGN